TRSTASHNTIHSSLRTQMLQDQQLHITQYIHLSVHRCYKINSFTQHNTFISPYTDVTRSTASHNTIHSSLSTQMLQDQQHNTTHTSLRTQMLQDQQLHTTQHIHLSVHRCYKINSFTQHNTFISPYTDVTRSTASHNTFIFPYTDVTRSTASHNTTHSSLHTQMLQDQQ